MAARKPGKKVIDHDPLAWLGDEEKVVKENKSVSKEAVEMNSGKTSRPAQSYDTTESRGILSLGESLTIKNVADIKKQISETLVQNSEINLESARLQKIDTAGLQLLYSLQKSLAVSQQRINWIDSNPMIESASRLTGLTEIIEGVPAGFGFFDDPATEPESKASTDQGFGFF